MLGYHVTGSTGTVFLYGLVFGAVAMLGLALVLGGARRSSRRGTAARRSLRQSRRETTAVSQDRDDLIGQRDEAARARAVSVSVSADPASGTSVDGASADGTRAGTTTGPGPARPARAVDGAGLWLRGLGRRLSPRPVPVPPSAPAQATAVPEPELASLPEPGPAPAAADYPVPEGPGQESRRRIGVGRAGAVPGGRRASRRTGRVARLRPPTPGPAARVRGHLPALRKSLRRAPGFPRRQPRKMVQLSVSLRTWQVRPCISGGPAGPDFLVHGTVLEGTAATDGKSPGEFLPARSAQHD
jgi:hypothetical protein